MSPDHTRTDAIRARIGEGFLQRLFGGKSFLHCVVELVKNCRDWGATLIQITTNEGRHLFRVVDNGEGMNAANRNAFASIHLTTAHGERQAGQFCTGTKQFLFSHASHVAVVTAPEDEPEIVYHFSFTTAEYERLVLAQGEISPEKLTKTQEVWPYDFPFGTVITYTLKDPNSRSIFRGERLAEELAARLPIKLEGVVQVDGSNLPPKVVVGTFRMSLSHAQLEEVSFEIYRPEKRHGEEDLRLGSVEVGEAPMANLARALGDLRDEIPPVFLLPDVCGTITVPFLRQYANEDRFTFAPEITDDPRSRLFVRLLAEVATEVQRLLKIKLSTTVDEGAEEAEVREVVSRLNTIYGKSANRPQRFAGGEEGDSGTFGGEGGGGGGRAVDPMRLTYRKEFEPDEPIEIEVVLRRDLKGKISLDDVQWYTDRSRAKEFARTPTGARMTAQDIGHGVIMADIPGTPFAAKAHYEVVPIRIFRITAPFMGVRVSSEVHIMTANHDKVAGQILWKLEGVGELNPQDRRATYRATRAGTAVVTAYDSADAKRQATCDLTVTGEPVNLLCLRGEWFNFQHVTAEGGEFRRPVIMRAGREVHNLFFCQNAFGFREASRQGMLRLFLLQAIAQEFPAFSRFEQGGLDLNTLDPRDVPGVLQEIRTEGFEIFEEMLRGKP